MPRIAFMTVALLTEEWDDPASKGFVDRIAGAVQTLEKVEGFIASDFDEAAVWGDVVLPRLTERPEFANRCAYSLSLWDNLEAVFAYTYNAAHGEALRHRREWFQSGDWPSHVAWWVADDHVPTVSEGTERWERRHALGPTPAAFDFKHAFGADGRVVKIDRERVRRIADRLPTIDSSDAETRVGASA